MRGSPTWEIVLAQRPPHIPLLVGGDWPAPNFLEEEMTNTYELLQSKLTLDPLDFDHELVELPLLIMRAGEETAKAVARRDRAKNALDLAIAEASDHLRRQP